MLPLCPDTQLLYGCGNWSWMCTSQWETPRGKRSQSSPGFVLPQEKWQSLEGAPCGDTAWMWFQPRSLRAHPKHPQPREEGSARGSWKEIPRKWSDWNPGGNGALGTEQSRAFSEICVWLGGGKAPLRSLCSQGRKQHPALSRAWKKEGNSPKKHEEKLPILLCSPSLVTTSEPSVPAAAVRLSMPASHPTPKHKLG